GDFVVVWQNAGYPSTDGSGQAVMGQRFRTTAFTAPEPVDGSRVVLHDNPLDARRKSLSARADDATIDLGGGVGSIDDPTMDGGHLRVGGANLGDSYDRPAPDC